MGGQVDFIRGAALSLDGRGKPILAMPSTTSRGESKIVPLLKPGEKINHYVDVLGGNCSQSLVQSIITLQLRSVELASQHETLTQYWFNVGPPSATPAQH